MISQSEMGEIGRVPPMPEISVDLEFDFEALPQGDPCDLCGSSTNRTFIPHRMTGDKIIVSTQTPGYSCSDTERCGVSYLSHEGFLAALGAAIPILQEYGDNGTADAFQERIIQERALFPIKSPTDALPPSGSGNSQ